MQWDEACFNFVLHGQSRDDDGWLWVCGWMVELFPFRCLDGLIDVVRCCSHPCLMLHLKVGGLCKMLGNALLRIHE